MQDKTKDIADLVDPPEIFQDQLFEELKKVLLREDRLALEELKTSVNDPKRLGQLVGPLIEAQLGLLRAHFSESYYNVVDNMIYARLKVSHGEIMDTIYPVTGKMIKKYV